MIRRLRELSSILLLLFAALPAFGQGALLQGGPWQPGHVPQYVGQSSSQAVVQDGGGAGGGAVGVNPSEIGVTARGTGTPPYAGQGSGAFGTNICDYDAPITNPGGYHYLCLSANAQGGGLLAYGAGGGAAPLPFQLYVNGTFSPFPFPQTVTEVTPEQFGYGCSQPGCIPYGTGDAGIAINAAMNSVPAGFCVKVTFGAHQYNVVTPLLASKGCKWMSGVGNGTVWYYTPSVCSGSLFTAHDSTSVVPINFIKITDIEVISPDFGCPKVAINLVDIGDSEISQVYCPLWHDATSSSVCLQTNGRQTSSFHDLRLFGDIPFRMLANPNSLLSADHFHVWNVYLSPANTQPSVTAGDILITNSTFDGFQAYVGGSYGFYWNAPTVTGRGTNLVLNNIRCEEGQNVADYCIYLNTPNAGAGGIAGVSINDAKLDEARLGIFARGVLSLGITRCYYPPVSPAALKFLDVDTTVTAVSVDGCRFESGVVQSLGGLTPLAEDFVPSTAPVPTTARYAASAISRLFPTSVQTSILGTAIPLTQAGTSYTVGANDSSLIVNASGSFTLTLPAASANAGRWINLKSVAAQTVASATSNVVPLAGGAAGTAILAATAGKWVNLQSDGTNWIIMASN